MDRNGLPLSIAISGANLHDSQALEPLVRGAERQVAGAGKHAASPRFAENVPFTAAHAVDAMEWTNDDWPVAHVAAIAWPAVKAGEPLTVLSLEPELYTGTGITPLNPA